MGKVGSTAIAATIAEETGRQVLQCHQATAAGVAASAQWHQRFGASTEANRNGHNLRWLIATSGRSAARQEVVCGVRDPIARGAAAAFQVGHRFGLFDQNQPELSPEDVDRLVSYVIEVLQRPVLGTLNWFDQELEPVTGIDVYATPFDYDNGYEMYENDVCRVLLIRFENLASVATEAFEAFFGRPAMALRRRNVGASKAYSKLYQQFRREATFPESTLDEIYDSQYVKHFYSGAEIAAHRAEWSTSRPNGPS